MTSLRRTLGVLAAGTAFVVAASAAAQQPQAPVPLAPAPAPALADAIPDANGVRRMVILRALDKITARTSEINAPVGVPVTFAALTIVAHYCHSTPPEEPPETTAFLDIVEQRAGSEPRKVFSGWMFASSPALHAMEHPIYDVWVISCKTDAPEAALLPAP